MTPPRELEIKLEVPATQLPRLRRVAFINALKEPPTRETEVSVYFDTDKHKLHKKGLMLRVRRIGEHYVQTIKAAAGSGPFERGEWEEEIATPEPDLSLAHGADLKPLRKKGLRRRLKPMFETRVNRTVYALNRETSSIELAVDRGKINTNNNSASLSEIELELKYGNREDLFAVAREIARVLPAQLAFRSKSDRGYELIDGDLDTPTKSKPVDLSGCSDTRDGFRAIGRACLEQIVANEPALLAGDPEGVHQMRVGVRRLRAAMSLFSDILDDPQSAAIKTELKWLMGELTPAREFQVLMKRIAPIQKERTAVHRGVPALSKELTTQRDAAFERAENAVKSPRFRALTLEVAAWLETGGWTKPQDDLVSARGEQPIVFSATKQLSRRWRKVRKGGKALAELDARQRHKLRIQVKKLRYAAEFFGTLFAGRQLSKRRKKFVAALEHLQDGLGDLNDIAVDEELISEAGLRRRRANHRRTFAAGLLTGREEASLDDAMAAAVAGYGKLVKIKPFWR